MKDNFNEEFNKQNNEINQFSNDENVQNPNNAFERSGYYVNAGNDWYEERKRNIAQRAEQKRLKKERNYTKTPLVFALIGLLGSLFIWVGIGFSITAFVLALNRLKHRQSRSLRWAILISIVGMVLSVLFIFGFIYAIVAGYLAELNEVASAFFN